MPLNLRKQAPKSLVQSPGLVSVQGIGKVWAEGPDEDDTFPPAIASYAFKDGWLCYRGRNGSEGVIVGSLTDLQKWIKEVEANLASFPLHETRPWTSTDGGADNIKRAEKAAQRVLRSARPRFFVREGDRVEGEHGADIVVINGHLDVTTTVGGVKVHAGSQVAAHEAAHEFFSLHRKEAASVMEALKQWGGSVSTYHALAGDFEGLMDAVSWWALSPRTMLRKAPELYQAILVWLRPQAGKRAFSASRLAMKIAVCVTREASYLDVGDIVAFGKYKNKKGRIVKFDTDEKGDPTVEIEPIPKGRKQNQVLKLFKIRRLQKGLPSKPN